MPHELQEQANTPEQHFDLRVETRFKNAVLYRALHDTFGGMAKAHKIAGNSPGTAPVISMAEEAIGCYSLSALLNLKSSPYKRDGEPTVDAKKIAEYLGREVAELFPAALYQLGLPKVVVRELCSAQVRSLQELNAGEISQSADLDAPFIAEERRQLLGERLKALTPNREIALRMKFGLDDCGEATFEEIGQRLGVTRERARQIVVRGLRDMSHPSRAHGLQQYVAR